MQGDRHGQPHDHEDDSDDERDRFHTHTLPPAALSRPSTSPDEKMDGAMANDVPSHLPPVLRPDDPPVHSLEDLAARFALETRGDLSGVSLTGLTLATADLRPGDVFVAVRGVNRHGAEFAACGRGEGRRRGRHRCRGRRRRRTRPVCR